nr:hypothetical protein SOV_6c01110 [Sporomusa ovata DSM 2662]
MNLRTVASLIVVWIVGVVSAVVYLIPPAEGLGYLVRIVFFIFQLPGFLYWLFWCQPQQRGSISEPGSVSMIV